MPAQPTSKRIAIAARRLLDKEGAEAVTMRRVAAAVGITAMAVYRHYPDRKGLLNALADEGFEELAQKLAAAGSSSGGKRPASVEDRLTRLLDVNLSFALENPRLFELMFLTPREGARQYPRDFKAEKSPTANVFADLIREGIASGYFRKTTDVWAIVFETGALWQGLMMLYLGGRVSMPAAQYRMFCHESLRRYMDGIRA
ncbi:MAG TPA: TetR/AcrR family transcriptional regulator [Acidobacteriaceae bacterium]|nr:TetR/AcrR family transcriptional regulator [Acidobacteriaceae bacterium]